jgi:hypothetical protein
VPLLGDYLLKGRCLAFPGGDIALQVGQACGGELAA